MNGWVMGLLITMIGIGVLLFVGYYDIDRTLPTKQTIPVYCFQNMSPMMASPSVVTDQIYSQNMSAAEAPDRPYSQKHTSSSPLPSDKKQVLFLISQWFLQLEKSTFTNRPKPLMFELNKKIYKLSSDIQSLQQQTEPILFVSGGTQCFQSSDVGGLGRWVYHSLRTGMFAHTCVGHLLLSDHRRAFNFCQEQDILPIHLVAQQLASQNPQAPLLFYGRCKGGSTMYRALSVYGNLYESNSNLASLSGMATYEWISRVRAFVCESPINSVENFLEWSRGGRLAMTFVRFWFPNCDPHFSLVKDVQGFPSHIAVLMGSLPVDRISMLKDVVALTENIKIAVKHPLGVELWITNQETIRHGYLTLDNRYQIKVPQFYTSALLTGKYAPTRRAFLTKGQLPNIQLYSEKRIPCE